MSTIRQILGDNIRILRKQKGWTQVYVADSLGITAPFLVQIESGKRGISLDLIEKVSVLFEVPVYYLFINNSDTIMDRESYLNKMRIQVFEKSLKEKIETAIYEAIKILE